MLFYVTDDDRAGEDVEELIRTAGFEPVNVGGIEQSGRLELGGDLHDLVVGPPRRAHCPLAFERCTPPSGHLLGRSVTPCRVPRARGAPLILLPRKQRSTGERLTG